MINIEQRIEEARIDASLAFRDFKSLTNRLERGENISIDSLREEEEMYSYHSEKLCDLIKRRNQ